MNSFDLPLTEFLADVVKRFLVFSPSFGLEAFHFGGFNPWVLGPALLALGIGDAFVSSEPETALYGGGGGKLLFEFSALSCCTFQDSYTKSSTFSNPQVPESSICLVWVKPLIPPGKSLTQMSLLSSVSG